jgi:hypothetical protein
MDAVVLTAVLSCLSSRRFGRAREAGPATLSGATR